MPTPAPLQTRGSSGSSLHPLSRAAKGEPGLSPASPRPLLPSVPRQAAPSPAQASPHTPRMGCTGPRSRNAFPYCSPLSTSTMCEFRSWGSGNQTGPSAACWRILRDWGQMWLGQSPSPALSFPVEHGGSPLSHPKPWPKPFSPGQRASTAVTLQAEVRSRGCP